MNRNKQLNIIASQKLKIIGTEKIVEIQIFRPRKLRKDRLPLLKNQWICPFKIIGLEKRLYLECPGTDSLQVLLIAISAIINTLKKSQKKFENLYKDETGKDWWVADSSDGNGFPILKWCNTAEERRKILNYIDKIEKQIEKECLKLWKSRNSSRMPSRQKNEKLKA
jgi:hypothetical protein